MSQTVIKPSLPKQRDTGVWPRRWTREEYYRAAECGVFQPGERLELLNGEILQKMSPQRTPHSTAMEDTARSLEQAFGPGYYARRQLPLILTDRSEPEPDVVVVPGKPRDYLGSHPTAAQARLVVEVADSTLRLDRGRKLASYARAGIAEYWIENLPDRRLEVYREPTGSRYRSVTVHTEHESIAPLAAPHSLVRIADLLPPLDQELEVVSGEGEQSPMIRVTVELVGRAAEAGQRTVTLQLPDGATPAAAAEQLTARFPALTWLRRVTKPAVNLEYTTWDHPLQEGDEVAFIPPVSGG